MIILGIDPSISQLGYGLIKVEPHKTSYITSGIVKTNSKTEIPLRLVEIYDSINKIIDDHRPNILSIETIFYKKDVDAILKLSYVRGVIMLLTQKKNLYYEEYPPKTIKKTITGSGNAAKEQIIKMIKIFLPQVDSKIHDENDALAIAYTSSILTQYKP